MSLYLQRHYQVYVSPTTILKIFHRHHVGRVSLKRYRPGPKPHAEGPLPVPGQSVQVDVKFVPRVGRARQRFYQFTAIDEATRYRVLRVYDYNNTHSAVAFLDEVRRRLPFAIQRIQTDNDSSFGPQFTWHLADLGIARRPAPKSTARSSAATRPTKRSFYRGKQFRSRKQLTRKLKRWEKEYNEQRPHLALTGETLAERVQELDRPSQSVSNPS